MIGVGPVVSFLLMICESVRMKLSVDSRLRLWSASLFSARGSWRNSSPIKSVFEGMMYHSVRFFLYLLNLGWEEGDEGAGCCDCVDHGVYEAGCYLSREV